MKTKKIHNLSTEGFNTLSNNIKGFTLVEMLVAMTIFGIIMVSVMMIYSISTQISIKSDINREMQQNIKSTIETIAEDVRKNKLIGVPNSNGGTLPIYGTGTIGVKIKTSKYEYALFGYEAGKIVDIINDSDLLENNSTCSNIKNICFIMKCKNQDCITKSNRIGPLSNSKTTLVDLNFSVIGKKYKKLDINFIAKPSVKKGLASKLIDKSQLIFQTTLSERKLKVK